MKPIKGIYHNGVIELIEKPETQETSEVLVIFSEKRNESKIGELFKNYDIVLKPWKSYWKFVEIMLKIIL